jgi:glyoxylase I family protein
MTMSNRAGIAGVHHIALRVANLERSLALYRDTLGFVLKTAFTLNDRRFALLETGNSGYVELVETKQGVHPGRTDDVVWHFAARTDDIERSLDAVATAGYEITKPVTPLDLIDTTTNQPFSIRIAFFRGPDGEDVELFEDKSRHT